MRLRRIPAMAQRAVPDNVTGPNCNTAEPNPSTNMELAIIKLRT